MLHSFGFLSLHLTLTPLCLLFFHLKLQTRFLRRPRQINMENNFSHAPNFAVNLNHLPPINPFRITNSKVFFFLYYFTIGLVQSLLLFIGFKWILSFCRVKWTILVAELLLKLWSETPTREWSSLLLIKTLSKIPPWEWETLSLKTHLQLHLTKRFSLVATQPPQLRQKKVQHNCFCLVWLFSLSSMLLLSLCWCEALFGHINKFPIFWTF